MDEIFPLVDEQGNVIGKATRKECHGGTFWLHPVVHLHIFNSKGELCVSSTGIIALMDMGYIKKLGIMKDKEIEDFQKIIDSYKAF